MSPQPTLSPITQFSHNPNITEMLSMKLFEFKQDTKVPTEASFVDFIGHSVIALDQSIEQLKQYKSTIQDKINQALTFKTEFLVKGASLFRQHNYSKLEGIDISSITIAPAKDETIEVKNVFNCDLSKKEQEQTLVKLGYASYSSKEELIQAKDEMLKINKRKNMDVPNFAELLFSRHIQATYQHVA